MYRNPDIQVGRDKRFRRARYNGSIKDMSRSSPKVTRGRTRPVVHMLPTNALGQGQIYQRFYFYTYFIIFNVWGIISRHSVASPSLECCHFHNTQPAIYIMGLSPGPMHSKVEWVQVRFHGSCPCAVRVSNRPLPSTQKADNHCSQGLGAVLGHFTVCNG